MSIGSCYKISSEALGLLLGVVNPRPARGLAETLEQAEVGVLIAKGIRPDRDCKLLGNTAAAAATACSKRQKPAAELWTFPRAPSAACSRGSGTPSVMSTACCVLQPGPGEGWPACTGYGQLDRVAKPGVQKGRSFQKARHKLGPDLV